MAASPSPLASKALFKCLKPTRRRAFCPYDAQFLRTLPSISSHPPRRTLSTTRVNHSESELKTNQQRPRWSYTPAGMVAPVRSRPPRRSEPWIANQDPKVLDAFYVRFLGAGGDALLKEETKWLAVTHKSFDHGRRGFNDRLSYLGKRIVELQMSLTLLGSDARDAVTLPPDQHNREPFRHPATEGIEILDEDVRARFLHHVQIASLGRQYGLEDVIRWNPRNPESLKTSGVDMVMTQAMFAIVGALSLEKGGGEAHEIVRDRFIKPLMVKRKKH